MCCKPSENIGNGLKLMKVKKTIEGIDLFLLDTIWHIVMKINADYYG